MLETVRKWYEFHKLKIQSIFESSIEKKNKISYEILLIYQVESELWYGTRYNRYKQSFVHTKSPLEVLYFTKVSGDRLSIIRTVSNKAKHKSEQAKKGMKKYASNEIKN